jgi:hypothetical protein
MSAESVLIMVTASATTLLWLFVMAWREGTYLGRCKAWADSRAWMLRVNARQHEDHHTENHQLRGELRAMEDALGKHRADSATARNLLEAQRKTNAWLVERAKEEAEASNRRIAERMRLTQALDALTDASESLKAELAGERDAHEVTRCNAGKEIAALRADVAGLQVALGTERLERDAARAELEEMGEIRTRLANENSRIQSVVKRVQAAASRLTLTDTDREIVVSPPFTLTPPSTPTPPPGFRAVQVERVTDADSFHFHLVPYGKVSSHILRRADIILPEGVKFYDRDVTVYVREGVAV